MENIKLRIKTAQANYAKIKLAAEMSLKNKFSYV
jgi:hypothetical protein